jgi:CheY-like chemotaxis protein
MYDQGTAPIIMFVDDEPENLNLLQEFFAKSDYALRFFTSGAHALKAAQEDMPDLVLLDIRLPGIDGYDVCRQFKPFGDFLYRCQCAEKEDRNRTQALIGFKLATHIVTDAIPKGAAIGKISLGPKNAIVASSPFSWMI